jgi:hypothetical protein
MVAAVAGLSCVDSNLSIAFSRVTYRGLNLRVGVTSASSLQPCSGRFWRGVGDKGAANQSEADAGFNAGH